MLAEWMHTENKNKTWNIWEKQLAQYPTLPAPPPPPPQKKKKKKKKKNINK